jgi:hypothetical protein
LTYSISANSGNDGFLSLAHESPVLEEVGLVRLSDCKQGIRGSSSA